MNVLLLVNWKVEKCKTAPHEKQPADYQAQSEPYWFFRYFSSEVRVDILDTPRSQLLDFIERRILHFHLLQGLRAVFLLNRYDLVVSHGMTSAMVVALWRRLFKSRARHIVFDIGCFQSASKSGAFLRLLQFVSRSLDFVIYHTACQEDYYRNYFPWLSNRSRFVKFGVDPERIDALPEADRRPEEPYILCVGAGKDRDRDTLVQAFSGIQTDFKLLFLGGISEEYRGNDRILQADKVPFSEMIAYIDRAEFCVLPLYYHEYSYGQMTLLDQMVRGKCVLTADVPSFEKYVQDGTDAVLYRVGDREDCRRKLLSILENEGFRKQIGERARQTVNDSLNERRMAQALEEIFIKECGESGRA